jgi:hypothetical protein
MTSFVFPAAAYAQSSTDVVTKAEHVFGPCIRLERIGIYSESQVQVFSLAEAGAFRSMTSTMRP